MKGDGAFVAAGAKALPLVVFLLFPVLVLTMSFKSATREIQDVVLFTIKCIGKPCAYSAVHCQDSFTSKSIAVPPSNGSGRGKGTEQQLVTHMMGTRML